MVQKNSIKNKIIIICGPTASGKTTLAVECAKLLNSEVISADSMYIYKHLNIGTAKPNSVEMAGITHHMIDVVSPFDNFSVSNYKSLATPLIDNLISKNKVPIICGGTGFYINSILYDLSYGQEQGNQSIRDKYKKLAQEHGNQYVYNILKDVDNESADKLHYNDLKRVIRALELYECGTKKSDLNDTLEPKYNYKAYSIDFPRETLYTRINHRVDKMLDQGLLDEIKNLTNMGLTRKNQCMQAIGYKEILDYIDGNCTLNDAIENIKLNTRHYAKRQITFFKKLNVIQLPPEDVTILAKQIIEGLHYD